MRLNFRRGTTVLVGLLLVAALATLAVVGIGAAQSAEYSTNETVTLENDTEPITVSVDWNESASSADLADVTFYDETAYANNSTTAMPVLEDSLTVDAGNSTEGEYNQTDGDLELGNEYRVVVSGPSTIDSASVDDSSGFLGAVPGTGGLEGGGGMIIGIAVIAVAVIGAAAIAMQD